MTAKTSNTVKFVQPAAKRYARVLYELEIPKADIEKTKENRNLQDQILEVVVPVEDATEIKNGNYGKEQIQCYRTDISKVYL